MDRAERIRAQRDKATDRVNNGPFVMPMPPDFQTAVVGVSFTPTYPDNLHALADAWLDSEVKGEPLACVIVRNPDNTYDPNACEVHVPALGDDAMVGHITKSVAARLAPDIDAGAEWMGCVTFLKMNEEYPDRPGLEIRLLRRKEHG